MGTVVLCIVLPARAVFGYPWCRFGNDETFWQHIVESRIDGVFYPISGHAFVWVTQSLVSVGSFSASQVVSLLGALSAPLACIGVYLGYRKWLPSQAFPSLILLATTAYFWAPLIESKPQQWGQPLVLLGALLFSSWLHRRGASWWWMLVIATSLALVHSLSFAILCVTCGLVWLVGFAITKSRFADGLQGGLAFLPGWLVLAWPTGPYARSMEVVWEHHIVTGSGVFAVLALALAGMLTMALGVRALERRGALVRFGVQLVEQEQFATSKFGLGLLVGLVGCLVLQVVRLPELYWGLYGNSVLQFLVAQSGNLLFLILALKGLFVAIRLLLQDRLDSGLYDAMILSVACICIAIVGLGISFWMIDENWFLRVVNYAVLFAAPLAIHGLGWDQRLPSIPMRIALCAGAVVSVLLALRWSAFISC